MSNQKSLSVVQQRENILAVACSSLAQDLRKIAPADYVLFFSTNKMPELFDQICGLFEQHFPSGNMSFACTGGYFNSWVEPPVVGLDVEFETPDVFAFFRLYFAEKGVAVGCSDGGE